MELRVVHHTTYRYEAAVDLAQHLLHLTPRDTATQRVLRHSIEVDPRPATLRHASDAFGNHRVFFSQQAPHQVLAVLADSTVQTAPPAVLPEGGPLRAWTWERVREHFRYRAHAPFDAAADFAFASPLVPRDDRFAAWARPAFASGTPVLQAARALMERIHAELRYEPASTEVGTPALQALAQGKGVCQDFAHIMIGCLRSLGLPARYVSGYLLTRPPPGQPRLVGADASHAWVAVYVPREDGPHGSGGAWFDFDPTNNRCGAGSPGEDYVTLAIGRDFSDVSPMRGVIQSGAPHTLDVAVTVSPAAEPQRPPGGLDRIHRSSHAARTEPQMSALAKLSQLGITLPPVATPAAAYVPFAQTGSLVFLSGHIARKDGKPWVGQLGLTMSTAEGKEAARAITIDLLGTLQAACQAAGKTLDDVKRIVKVMSLVNSTATFTEQHLVTNGCSELLGEVFGPAGAHARSAFGVAQIPMGACVEIELIAELA